MRKSFLNQRVYNLLCSSKVDMSGRQGISPGDDALSRNCTEYDGLCVSRFEANGCSRRDIQTFTVCETAIECQLRVSLNEMVMRSDLGG